MSEGDQTKWVGVRPTNPAENIPTTESNPLTEININPAPGMDALPVTESAPLTDILVAPSAGGPLFLTETEKRAPAIGDLQAVSGFVRFQEIVNNVGSTPQYDHVLYTVPSGKMFVLELISAYSWQAGPTNIYFVLKKGADIYIWYRAAYGGIGDTHVQRPNIWYDEDEIVIVRWAGIIATDDVWGCCFGHLVDKY